MQEPGVARLAGEQREVHMRGPVIRPMVLDVSIAVGAIGMTFSVMPETSAETES